MTPEEKQLVLQDICARLLYRSHVRIYNHWTDSFEDEVLIIGNIGAILRDFPIEDIKPYLRPMSSMTDEEEGMYNLLQGLSHLSEQHWTAKDDKINRYADAIDWLNAHHFDYRGLIPMGLALEAPEGMYKIE